MLVFTFIGCFGLESLTLMLFFGYLTKEIVKVNQEKLYRLDTELTLQSLFWEDFSSLQDLSDLSTKGNLRVRCYRNFWDSLGSFRTVVFLVTFPYPLKTENLGSFYYF